MSSYPFVVIYSDHHISCGENRVYIANNDEDLLKIYKEIFRRYWDDWYCEDKPEPVTLEEYKKSLEVNTYRKNWFDGMVFERKPETI